MVMVSYVMMVVGALLSGFLQAQKGHDGKLIEPTRDRMRATLKSIESYPAIAEISRRAREERTNLIYNKLGAEFAGIVALGSGIATYQGIMMMRDNTGPNQGLVKILAAFPALAVFGLGILVGAHIGYDQLFNGSRSRPLQKILPSS